MEEQQRRDRQMLIPIWKGTTVYCESVFVLEDVFGQIRPLRLAYPIKRIAEVRSADLTVTYREGKDYGVNEYGELEILRGEISRIFPGRSIAMPYSIPKTTKI
ncbi:MAG: hypothetical protein ACLR06_09905 [Christensenellaceae bacterium]